MGYEAEPLANLLTSVTYISDDTRVCLNSACAGGFVVEVEMQQYGKQHPTPSGDGATALSLVEGPTHPPLVRATFGQLIDQQADSYGSKDAVIVPWTRSRLNYADLKERTQAVARSLLALGVRTKDHIAILCGDDERFIELFFGCGRIGAVLVILNKTYTPFECERAIRHTGKSGSSESSKRPEFRAYLTLPAPQNQRSSSYQTG